MTRTSFALLAFAAFAGPAAAEERRFAVGDFDRVIIEGPYSVHLVTGRASAARASGTRDALDRVTVDVQGQILRVRRNRNAWAGGAPGADAGTVTVELATRSVRSARLIGPARLDLEGARGLNVELSVEGSGNLRAVAVDADTLALALLGSGRLDVAGAAHVLNGNFQGTGDVAATNLRAGQATIATTTSGTVAVTVNGPAAITANGLGNVRVLGRPVCTLSGVAADQVQCGGSDQGQHR
jgi:Putative auto-transporter adhesin, head GIN domain